MFISNILARQNAFSHLYLDNIFFLDSARLVMMYNNSLKTNDEIAEIEK